MLFGLIPLVGPAGAAIAMIASECMVTSWMMRETARVTSLPSFSILYRPLASAAGMCCTVLLLRDAGVFVQMAASLVVFAAIAVVVGGMTGEEIRFLRERFV
jgi:O-antigen/teichoic acid export membrane protein